MNIGELREELAKYPKTAKVMITWEGIFHLIRKSNIYRAPNGVVVMDADENFYKREILDGQKRPR